MAFDFAQARAAARRTVHDTMRVAGAYTPPGGSVAVEVHLRWHHKMTLSGDVDNAGYAQMMVGIEVAIFDKEELVQNSIVLERGGQVALLDGTVLSLDAQHPHDGPIKVMWSVSVKQP